MPLCEPTIYMHVQLRLRPGTFQQAISLDLAGDQRKRFRLICRIGMSSKERQVYARGPIRGRILVMITRLDGPGPGNCGTRGRIEAS